MPHANLQATPGARRLGPHVSVIPVQNHSGDRNKPQRALQRTLADWRTRDGVIGVEPNQRGRFEAIPLASEPNDPGYAAQWWMTAVDGLRLWSVGQGAGVRIALIDSGVSLVHPDLSASVDDDGYDFGDDDASPDDGFGHGTAVAGIIAARANNGVGIAGLAPASRLLPIKVSRGSSGDFDLSAVIQAVDHAVARSVHVINMSLVFDQPSDLLRSAIQAALDRGIVVVAAAGNAGGTVAFPASMPGVIGVAGTDRQGALATSSNRGPEIAIAAPGTDIYTTALASGYANRSGTSFATPIVSATLAALRSANPSLPANTLQQMLRDTATPLGGQPFGTLRSGEAATAVMPGLSFPSSRLASGDTVETGFRLPPSLAPIDLYVAVSTPVGEFSLLPNCRWQPVTDSRYLPIAIAYRSTAAISGKLFGSGGLCPAIPLAGLPAGNYDWRIAATYGERMLGAISTERMTVAP